MLFPACFSRVCEYLSAAGQRCPHVAPTSRACVCAGGLAQGGEAAASVSNSLITVRENAQEYDPAHPNDYEEVRRSREAARKAAEAEAERQARIKADALRQEVREALCLLCVSA